PRSVVVVINEEGAKAAVPESCVAEFCPEGGVFEKTAAEIPVQARMLQIEVGDKNVQPAVTINVSSVNSHARLRLAVFADGDAGLSSDFRKGSVVVVAEQEVGVGVVGDKDVLPPIVVEVEGYDAKAAARMKPKFGGFGKVRERAVSVVVIERRRLAAKLIRMAVATVTRLLIAAPDVILRRPGHVIGDHKV